MALSRMQPVGFMSYSHFDDRHDNGQITALCKRLSDEVEAQTKRKFPIFQDFKSIEWGENWRERITSSLNEATFLIPIVTPMYLASEHCKKELSDFLVREEKLGRMDLVLPIIYLGSGDIAEWDIDIGDELLVRAIGDHQVVDWRPLRFRTIRDRKVRDRIATLAEQIGCALRRTENAEKSRPHGEDIGKPRCLAQGDEQAPMMRFLDLPARNSEPRWLLETAMMRKKDGDYQGAKDLHDEMLKRGIDWTTDIDLFVDQLYFAVSLHDKLEAWDELDALERHVFAGAFARIRPLITQRAYQTIRTMYQASMSISMLRQVRIADAWKRIDEVLDAQPGHPGAGEAGSPSPDAGAQILYANALITRALVLHAAWSLQGRDSSLLSTARADVRAAETIYREFAQMGVQGEFHHLGRFYGTRAFLRLAEWEARGDGESLASESLLDDATRAHAGDRRTAYGKVAGQYCEAYCRSRLSSLGVGDDTSAQHLDCALSLLKNATAALDARAYVARVKLTGLASLLANQAEATRTKWDATRLAADHEEAFAALRERERGVSGRLQLPAWLATPLN